MTIQKKMVFLPITSKIKLSNDEQFYYSRRILSTHQIYFKHRYVICIFLNSEKCYLNTYLASLATTNPFDLYYICK